MAYSLEETEYFQDDCVEDLSYLELDAFPEHLQARAKEIQSLQIDHNSITVLPRCVGEFTNLLHLDISNNQMTYISPAIGHLEKIKTLTAKNNLFEGDALPKEFSRLKTLEVVNFSGNRFEHFPMLITELINIKKLYLGANSISEIPEEIGNIKRLEVLYLGGNNLQSLPEEVGQLKHLTSLNLCDNKLIALPRKLAQLRKLQSLSLHNNQLSTLPLDIISLDLVELSLRNNPLVVRFVQDMIFQPPSLLELAGRVVKQKNIKFSRADLPVNLCQYLESAKRCVNPKCKGVYFTSRVEHVKFVDFCGKFRIPLLQYLCSPTCTTTPSVCYSSEESESDEEQPMVDIMKKVLLG